MGNVYTIISTVLWVILGFFVSYFRTKTNLFSKAEEAINYAEETYTDEGQGAMRMQWCINYLKNIIPAPMRFLFSDQTLENLTQAVFDRIQAFANQ